VVVLVTYHTFNWAWISYAFPALGVLFLLAGSLMAQSLSRRPAPAVVRSRFRRILPPVWALGAVLIPAMVVHGWRPAESGGELWWAQLLFWIVPLGELPASEWAHQLMLPLWFLQAYLWLVLLSPLLLRVFRWHPWLTIVISLIPTAALVVGEAEGAVAGILINVITFLTCWLLGFAHADGLLHRIPARLLLGASLLLMALGGWFAISRSQQYGTYDLNDVPLGQALWSVGLAVALVRFRPSVDVLRRVPLVDRAVFVLNARLMTVYLWQEVALVTGVALIDVMWDVPALADTVPLDNQVILYLVTWVLIAVIVVLFGWVEDLAAGRRPRPWPARSE
jgi:hypothetical protein